MAHEPVDHQQGWDELLAAAILGLDRRAFVVPESARQLAPGLAALQNSDPPAAMLGAAAVLASYRRAGVLAAQLREPAAMAALDLTSELPPCSARAGEYLKAILTGVQRPLLPEWLTLAQAAGRRVPDGLLPALLELAGSQAALRSQILLVAGPRGQWLAAQNPAWAELRIAARHELLTDQAAYTRLWETGTRAERLSLLAELRQRQPDAARTLLLSTWSSENAEDRAAMLQAIQAQLSMDDEPMLEAMLDDRSKEVRRIAASLLVRLPDSRLAARQKTRLSALLRFQAGEPARLLGLRPARPAQLEIVLPAECDKAMIRDGIEPKVPLGRDLSGVRGWWFQQLLAAVAPATWSTAWNATAGEILASVIGSEWQELCFTGWTAAIITAGDVAWAAALLQLAPNRIDLLPVLPVQHQEQLLLELLRTDCVPLHRHYALTWLLQTQHHWSLELSRAVLQTLYRHVQQWKDAADYRVSKALTDHFALWIPPELLHEISREWPAESGVRERWQVPLDRLLTTLQFRLEMREALRQ